VSQAAKVNGSPDVVCCTGGGALWGVDSVTPFTSSDGMWTETVADAGTPEVIARYIVGPYTLLNAAEVNYIHQKGAFIALYDDPSNTSLTGSALGVSIATTALMNAKRINVPAGVAIYLDIEPKDTVDSAF